jgi:hypothetical protein
MGGNYWAGQSLGRIHIRLDQRPVVMDTLKRVWSEWTEIGLVAQIFTVLPTLILTIGVILIALGDGWIKGLLKAVQKASESTKGKR